MSELPPTASSLSPGSREFRPSHVVPSDGLPTWPTPDPRTEPDNRLDPYLEVHVIAERNGWAHILCSNGWSAWVGADALIPISEPPRSRPAPQRSSEPPPRAASRRTGSRRGLGLGRWVTLGGGGLVVVSCVFDWLRAPVAVNAFQVPVPFLFGLSAPRPPLLSDVNLGFAALVVGTIAASTALLPHTNLLRRVCGSAAMGLATAYVGQVLRLPPPGGHRLSDLLGLGVALAMVGGLMVLIGSARASLPRARSA